ncbi:MAG: tetratricopeptide repeat protein [Planctomycetota bacterium]
MGRFDKLEVSSEQPDKRPKTKVSNARREVSWLEQAVEERRCGHYENALRLYSRALEDDKSLVTGWLGQVQMLVLLGEFVEAELWSRKALELFPGNGDLMAGRAQALGRNGDTTQALVLSDGSLKQTGQSAYRWQVRGELMAATKQETDRHCFDKAVQADPDWLVPLEIAGIYLNLDLPGRALDRARRAVELAADRYYAWFVQGCVERELGLASAAKSFQRCLDLCPGHVEAQRVLMQLDQGGWSFKRLWRRAFGSR